jgi:hypothetical protein
MSERHAPMPSWEARMKRIVLGIALTTFIAGMAQAKELNVSCSATKCYAGDKGTTYATKSDIFLACPTRELAEYTNQVIGIVALTISISGRPPNISDKTGEPEYLDGRDGPNESRLMLDRARKRANVRTFDEAAARCSGGANKVKVRVMNSPEDSSAIWVQNEKTKATFWMPKSHLDRLANP